MDHPSSAFDEPLPRLASGVELIGQYAGSGLEQPIFLARRSDGQVLQMSALLYAVAKRLDGARGASAVAHEVSGEFGRELAPEDVQYVVESKLRPLGVAASPDGVPTVLRRADPMLGLNFKARVVPASVVTAATRVAWPLFLPPVVLASVFALGFVDSWLLFTHGIAQGVREVVLRPDLSLVVLGLLLVGTALHELGHATACRYGGARPGPVGIGLYLAWPVFYSDVTDSYRLDRAGRLRTDLGGIYFNLLFALAVMGAYLGTHFEPLVLLVVLQQVEVLHQFFPFVRLDGYYVVSDLIGVPDLFQRLRPALSSMVPGRALHPRVAELKPWARVAVGLWVVGSVVVITALYALLVLGLPRLLGTARESFAVHWTEVEAAWRAGQPAAAALSVFQEALLLLPLIAIALTLARVARYLGRISWRFSASRPALRSAFALSAAFALGLAGASLAQPARFEPIQPTEHGTLPAAPVLPNAGPQSVTQDERAPRRAEQTSVPGTPTNPSQAPAPASVATPVPGSTIAPTPLPTAAPTVAPTTSTTAPSPSPSPSPRPSPT